MGVVDPSGGLTPDAGGGTAGEQGLTFLEQIDLAGTSSGLFDTVFNADFDKYTIAVTNITGDVASGSELRMRFASGSTPIVTSSYNYTSFYGGFGVGGNVADVTSGDLSPDAFIRFIAATVDINATIPTSFIIDLDRIDVDIFAVSWRGVYGTKQDNHNWHFTGSGNNLTPFDGLQLYTEFAEDFATGKMTAYGVAKNS